MIEHLDETIINEIDNLAQNYLEFKEWSLRGDNLDEKRRFDTERIIEICIEEKYDPEPYLNYYEEKIKSY